MLGNIKISVKKLNECGYNESLNGLQLSYNNPNSNIKDVSEKLCDKDEGHNKFLEFIMVWLEVTAPRYWWQEADTYRLSTKQSESTMHTLKKSFNLNDEELLEFGEKNFEAFSFEMLLKLRFYAEINDLLNMKAILPEGFLQKRIWCMSYKTLRNIILQRKNHKLPHWQMFIKEVLDQVVHPELLPKL